MDRSSAARLEALNEPEVRFVWRSHELRIPRAVEDWPLELIRAGLYVDAVFELLGDQTAPIPLYGDLVSLSDAMADAVGVSRLPETPALPESQFGTHIFGAVPLLLALLDRFEDDIAADLMERFGVDYRDRWRGDLTLRQIWTYVRRSKPDSALAVATNGGHEGWTKLSVITAQVWERLSGKVYAGRPMSKEEVDAALAAKRELERQNNKLKSKADEYSPEASQARREAWLAQKAARAGSGAAQDVPPDAMSAAEKAIANRRREISGNRKAG